MNSVLDIGKRMDLIIEGGLLLTARYSAFFVLSPFTSKGVMPRSVRFVIIGSATLFSLPALFAGGDPDFEGSAYYVLLLMKEVCLGFLLGVFTWVPLRSVETAAVILDTQRGAMQGSDLDVVFGAQTTPAAILMAQVLAGYFFAAGGWFIANKILFESVVLWPVTSSLPSLGAHGLDFSAQFLGAFFASAFLLALPVSGLMFITDVIIAYIARAAPSLNALAFGMPIKTMVFLITLVFYMDIIYPQILERYSEAIRYLSEVLQP
ncbi:EscT/YscT/HrcT family type III secretion system export apparatus protein [Brucella intermedia]|uniref:EscT/YscT/HrcT family type III secretion system export apparatus protein n=1 Tax=Brucella intermedia TaxID=94625 RepID=UPI002362B42A|nr:flagellar biosynthetic protein FliR [Brucella intermedia]